MSGVRASPTRRAPAPLVLAVAIVLGCAPGAARADVFGPISLVSAGALDGGAPQQAEYAHDAAVSGDGAYVVFDGAIGGVTGVWRRDLASGAIEQVAGGDAELPSVSADGRYVSFTTNEGLSLPTITNGRPDEDPRREAANVYVRDMDLGPTEAGAFAVVSAPSGSTAPLTYSGAGTTLGASAAGRSAISADGSRVAFVTTAPSNLVAYPKLEAEERGRGLIPAPHTPPLQVAVRDLQDDTTILVSRCYFHCTQPAGEGAAAPVVGEGQLGALYPGLRLEFPTVPESGEWPGAAISADGSTVAWMGENVGQQAPTLAAETLEPLYTEPLWRRIEPGSETATERITGGSDPTNPACVASGETALSGAASAADPCQGPFAKQAGTAQVTGIWGHGPDVGDFIPRLSADGYTVAFLSQAALVSGGYGAGRGGEAQESDLYLVDMHPGLTRDQALTPLTEIGPVGLAYSAPVADFDISPDGMQVAFTTARTEFPLSSPAFVSEPGPEPGLPELFDVDLADSTLTRVTHGYLGGPGEQPHTTNLQEEDQYGPSPQGFGALSPSFSATDQALVFTSTADNLVYGDGNTPVGTKPSAAPANGSDAFLVEPTRYTALATVQYVSPAPGTSTEPSWRLGLSAVSRPDGSVLLYVQVPGPGTLRAAARGAVTLVGASSAASHAPKASRAHRSARAHTASYGPSGAGAGAARGHISARNRRSTPGQAAKAVVERTLAAAGHSASAGELVQLPLRLGKPYAPLAARRGGLSATVEVTFSAPGAPTLHDSIAVTFLRKQATARSSAKRRSRRGRAAERPKKGQGL